MSTAPVSVTEPNHAMRGRRRLDLERPGRMAWSLRIFLLVLYSVPLFWLILTSFEPPGNVGGSAVNMFLFRPTLESYQAALQGGLLNAALQSVIIATGSTAITLLVALPAAYGLARVTGPVVVIALGALVGLQMLPQTATVIPLFQIFGAVHLLDTQIAVILADAALLAPWATLILRPFFAAVPESLEEAAALDGASGGSEPSPRCASRLPVTERRRSVPLCSCCRGASSFTLSTSSSPPASTPSAPSSPVK